MAHVEESLPEVWETRVRSLGQEDPLEKTSWRIIRIVKDPRREGRKGFLSFSVGSNMGLLMGETLFPLREHGICEPWAPRRVWAEGKNPE